MLVALSRIDIDGRPVDGSDAAESGLRRIAQALKGEAPVFEWVHRTADGVPDPFPGHRWGGKGKHWCRRRQQAGQPHRHRRRPSALCGRGGDPRRST